MNEDENAKKGKWVRNVETGERYLITEDTVLLLSLGKDGAFVTVSRCGLDRVHVITSPHSPPGTGWILSPNTEEPETLRRAEAVIVAALSLASTSRPNLDTPDPA